ncbi:MAG: PAS domain S-box protein [Candidatus Latescibacteria bacterium]|nr:PAS domain S-box protein [Candidatus Latescibacterota bacterium]
MKGLHQGRRRGQGENWLLKAVLIGILPLAVLALFLAWNSPYSPAVRWTLVAVIAVLALWCPLFIYDRFTYILRSIANLLLSLKEEDYSVRLKLPGGVDALGGVVDSVNELRDLLHRERTGAAETGALLAKVMERIDVALMAFDRDGRLKLANDGALRLLGVGREECLERDAGDLGLAACLEGADEQVVRLPGTAGERQWQLKRTTFRERGRWRTLLILADLTEPLRQQELAAWQRLVRVLRHEISNSLAPIQSYAQNMRWVLRQEQRDVDWEAGFAEGLEVILGRVAALDRMMAAYRGLTGLPTPQRVPVPVAQMVQAAVHQQADWVVEVVGGPPVQVLGDRGMLDQILVNLLKNAVEAASETNGQVRVGWQTGGEGMVYIWIEDEGPGLAGGDNLFVPFFTTKAEGSGIGLALSRQIVEAHGGRLQLDNRRDGPGCRALVGLPEGQE